MSSASLHGVMPSVRRGRTARTFDVDVGLRVAALQVGIWLGWASILVVLTGLAFHVGTAHRWLLATATLGAAGGNAIAMVIPWRDWLGMPRGRLLLDVWCAGLIAFVALLVSIAGPNFTLLPFLVVPFIAVVQTGRRRVVWLAVSASACTVIAALAPLSAGATAIRLMLVAVVASVAVLLARTMRRERLRAELDRALAQEANHRIKNDLQTAADLLLLARPDGEAGDAFDETASRIRSIATVHRLLTETEDHVDAAVLLRSIAAGAPVPVEIEADRIALDAGTAQKLGIVANELLTNAFRHGAPPIAVRLSAGRETHLRVESTGGGSGESGFGLGLVRRMVEQGLNGRFELTSGAVTRADVVFPS